MAQFFQFLFSGITVGAAYALVALGFTLIYNASGVINFAQGEFLMLGGMSAALMSLSGVPLPLAIVLGVVIAGAAGVLIEKFAVEPAKNADTIAIIILTIGASLVIRGLVQIYLGKGTHALPAFSGDAPIQLFGATILPQSLWAVGTALFLVCLLAWFFNRTLLGKAMSATSYNKLAAQLVGIDTQRVLLISFGLSAVLGAVGGIVLAPITYTTYDVGVMLGVKGFAAAVLGGLGGPVGAIAGGFLLGILEAMAAGYVSSAYKEAVALIVLLLVLFFMPQGLMGRREIERV